MGKKFDAIFESVVSRYQVGGYLPGDIVTFRPNYKSTETYKAMHSQMQKELDELVNSGLNIKVIQVGDRLAGVSTYGGNLHKSAKDIVLTVAGDHGGGQYFGSITVTPDMIDIADMGNQMPKIPDKFYRKDNTNWKPEPYKPDTTHPTRVSDKGNGKNTPTDIKLAGEGTRMKVDNTNMAVLYEEITVPKELVYENYLTEGLLRRFSSKLSGMFSKKPLKSINKLHEFSKSVAYEVGKDIAKTFGGDTNQHVKNIFHIVKNYIEKNYSSMF